MLIARRVRECNVYCEILPYDAPPEQVAKLNPKGFILSGGPASVYEADAPMAPAYIYESKVPVLGICYGMQALTHQLGGRVSSGLKREYGHAVLRQNVADHPIFRGLPLEMPVWMSHGDEISEPPPGFSSLAYTDNAPVAVLGNDQGIIGLQFHPEVSHTPNGTDILKKFPLRGLRLQGDVDAGELHSGGDGQDPGPGRGWEGDLCPVGGEWTRR